MASYEIDFLIKKKSTSPKSIKSDMRRFIRIALATILMFLIEFFPDLEPYLRFGEKKTSVFSSHGSSPRSCKQMHGKNWSRLCYNYTRVGPILA